MTPPEHVLVGSPQHGVTGHAALLAAALGAPARFLSSPDELAALRPAPRHVHVTDRLFGRTADEAADRLVALCRLARTTVTLHDLPQASDGTGFERRRRAYARILAAADGWAVSSQHERSLAHEHLAPAYDGVVVPLPVRAVVGGRAVSLGGRAVSPGGRARRDPARPTLGVLGWLYPGKGHEEVVEAAGALVRSGREVDVRAVGGVSPGHDDLAETLAAQAARLGVGWELTGYLPDDAYAEAMASVTVPVAAHGHVSASGSMTAWLEAGRRPLVAESAYARETAALRPGCYTLYDPARLADVVAEAVRDPASTWLPAGHVPPWSVADAAAAYAAWWAAQTP